MRPLEGFETEAQHAERFEVDPRTIRRWRNQPNGLPFTKAGRTVLCHVDWTIEWLRSNREQRNPAPKRGRAA
jgi:hypothetical protein